MVGSNEGYVEGIAVGLTLGIIRIDGSSVGRADGARLGRFEMG